MRLGVESQIVELTRDHEVCLSLLDFTGVRVLDYSCADEIIAKLLLRYLGDDRPGDAYFLAHGLADHHEDVIGDVLERHDLLLVIEPAEAGDGPRLLGRADPLQRASWESLLRMGRATADQLAADVSAAASAVAAAMDKLQRRRVVLADRSEHYVPLTSGFRAAG